MGRFINSDALEYLGDGAELSNYNLFAYCNNNPINYTDSSGCFGILATILISALAGAAFAALFETVDQISENGANPKDWNWAKIGSKALLGGFSGLALGAGAATGGIVIGSFATLGGMTVSQSIGVLLGTAVITNFAGGVGAYSLHCLGSDEDSFNVVKGISEGVRQTGKGLLNFYIGGMMVGANMWNVGGGTPFSILNLGFRSLARIAISIIPKLILDAIF